MTYSASYMHYLFSIPLALILLQTFMPKARPIEDREIVESQESTSASEGKESSSTQPKASELTK